MKSLVLSALMLTAIIAQTGATPRADTNPTRRITQALEQTIAFHRHNVDVLWQQYAAAEERIRKSPGNHGMLERDRVFFVGVYQRDIDNGIRVDESKKAIDQIEATYAKKHAQRDSYEKQKLAVLQAQLKRELLKEQKKFAKLQKKYGNGADDQTARLLNDAAAYFTAAITRVDHLSGAGKVIAAR